MNNFRAYKSINLWPINVLFNNEMIHTDQVITIKLFGLIIFFIMHNLFL